MVFKPKFSFSNRSMIALDHAAENVFTQMTGNPLFPDAVAEVADLGVGLGDYRTAVADAIQGGKHARTVRDQVRAALENKLQLLALHVQRVANGDPAVILAAGFEHNKVRQPKGDCPRPTNLNVIVGPIGSCRVLLKVKPEATARSYRFGYRVAGTSAPWTDVNSHGSTRSVEGLQQFAAYEFRAVYIGSNPDILDYSDTVVATVI